MLELNNVTAAYSGSKVLFDVSLEAKTGEVTCLWAETALVNPPRLKALWV